MTHDPIQFIHQQRELIFQTYEELHQLAEPSWHEENTSKYIIEMLNKAGLEVQTFTGHFGFFAEIKGEKPEVIALRADLDALVQEVDGIVRPNHSCGHDAHSTMVLFTALALAKSGDKFTHTLRFIFQPAEEKGEGALKMMEEGALSQVKFLGGLHLRPSIEVPYNTATPVILHGSTVSIKGVIRGVPAHAARPAEGNNSLEAAAILIQSIRQIRLKYEGQYSIKITELHGGEASNLIPGTAYFTFDLRARTNEIMEDLIKKAKHVIRTISELTDTHIDFELVEYSPAAKKNIRAIEFAKEAIVAVLGEEGYQDVCNSPGAEDFHFYTLNNPEIAATMIGLGCDLQPGLHHPEMKFNHEAMIYGTKILTNMLLEADQKQW